MKKNKLVLTLGFFFASKLAFADIGNCTSAWRKVNWKIVPFEDVNAEYLSYQFRIPAGEKLALKISGDFPFSRYMSYHVYNQVNENALSRLSDHEILPVAHAENPFRPGVDRYTPHRSYEIWATSGKSPNGNLIALPFSATSDRLIDIWLRVYVNERKLVPPSIEAFNAETLAPRGCPQKHEKEYSIATVPGPKGIRIPSIYVTKKVPTPFRNGEIHFFRPASDSLGANGDNRYLSTRLDGKALFPANTIAGRRERRYMRKTRAIQDIGNIAVFKFKKPTFPNTQKGLSTFSGKEELRYWSFCVSGESTATNECLLDARASTVKGADGENYVVVIVGPQSENLRRQAEKRGFHYLSHSPHRTPILFFRQMFARNDFVGNLERVTSLPLKNAESERELDKYFAEKFIGSYAPTGRQCWLTSHFFESLCGVKIEGKAEIEND